MAKLSPKARKAAEGMSKEQIGHYTETSRKNLPEHKKAAINFHEGLESLPPEMLQLLDHIFTSHPSVGRGLDSNTVKVLGRSGVKSISQNNPMFKAPIDITSQQLPVLKAAYVKGFIKGALDKDFTQEELPTLLKNAGFEKEAFLPLLLDLASMFGGGLGADWLAGKAVAKGLATKKVRNAAAEFLPGGAKGPVIDPATQNAFNFNVAPKINNWTDRLNHTVEQIGDIHQAKPWISGTAGSVVLPMLTSPITNHMRNAQNVDPNAQYDPQVQG